MHSDILKVAIARAKADANISADVGTRIYSHVPQNPTPPYIRVRWGEVEDLGDKTADFITGSLVFDYWTNVQDEGPVIDMMNYLIDEFHKQPLTLTEGSTNLLLTLQSYNSILESDAHHGVITFTLFIED